MSPICARTYDTIVVGAGIAGSALAVHLARRLGDGSGILLVERSSWPRSKVCGCCLNGAAIAMLDQLGIDSTLLKTSGERLSRVEVRCGKRAAGWSTPEGLAVSRAALDGLLVDQAIAAGVVFLSGCKAAVLPAEPDGRRAPASDPVSDFRVILQTSMGAVQRSARMVIVADGLAGSALDALPEFRAEIRPDSWIGLGGMIEDEFAVPFGTIGLNIGAHGYVGLVRLRDGTVNLAAAIDPAWVQDTAGPGSAIRAILNTCGVRVAEDVKHPWKFKGTALLTRRRPRVAAPGLLVIGDAAGYVEPFTGEGMTWALASAQAAGQMLLAALLDGEPKAMQELAWTWQCWYDSTIVGRQRISRIARAVAHRPGLASAAVSLLGIPPWHGAVGARIANRLCAPYSHALRPAARSDVPGAAA